MYKSYIKQTNFAEWRKGKRIINIHKVGFNDWLCVEWKEIETETEDKND